MFILLCAGGPTSILCNDPLPLLTNDYLSVKALVVAINNKQRDSVSLVPSWNIMNIDVQKVVKLDNSPSPPASVYI